MLLFLVSCLLLASVKGVMSLQCYACHYVTPKTTDAYTMLIYNNYIANSGMEENCKDSGNEFLEDSPNVESCPADTVLPGRVMRCIKEKGTMSITVQVQSTTSVTLEYNLWARGCGLADVDKDYVSDNHCLSDDTAINKIIQDRLGEIGAVGNLTDMDVAVTDGEVCSCDKDNCNSAGHIVATGITVFCAIIVTSIMYG